MFRCSLLYCNECDAIDTFMLEIECHAAHIRNKRFISSLISSIKITFATSLIMHMVHCYVCAMCTDLEHLSSRASNCMRKCTQFLQCNLIISLDKMYVSCEFLVNRDFNFAYDFYSKYMFTIFWWAICAQQQGAVYIVCIMYLRCLRRCS